MIEFLRLPQLITLWDWVGFLADIIGVLALPFTIIQLFQGKKKVNASIRAMNDLRTLQEHELLKKILRDISVQQDGINWMLEKHGQQGYRNNSFEEKCHEIIYAINGYLNELPIKYEEIIEPLRSVVTELHKYDYMNKTALEEAEGYLYSAIQAIKSAEEKCNLANIHMIAQG